KNAAAEADRLRRVWRGTHLEGRLLFVPYIEGLQMPASTQIPDMHLMSIFAAEEEVRLQSVFDHIRRAPFATQQRVEPQMPPEIVMQKLWAPTHLPLTKDFERLTIEHENTPTASAIGSSKHPYVTT